MICDCHMHMILDGFDWRSAIARHADQPEDGFIRDVLSRYQALGYTYLRDGGDRWGAGARARELAAEYGITYRTPLAPLCKTGHYGSFIGKKYEDFTKYRKLVAEAKAEGADAICHGCTGKGNDQVRFELAVKAFAPNMKIIAPWRTWELKSREDEIAYAEKHNIPIAQTKEKIYSRDQNIWHISHEGGNLENTWNEHKDDIHVMSLTPEQAKDVPSFIEIEFEKGMSGVVGPNGSGKSNISDAIRWVLGETRSSQLRAAGKMEDIIFGGTQKRSPMGFASVSLILDNTDRVFDVESDEVAVMRKYYRGGDSEYYINGARVRLRDIQELFFDTGLGKNGYSVVGQGKVSEIVTSKPEGRREIFEEASGIAKFRYKKNEAERKLDSAEGNITRLTDILMGLEERVEPLRKESEKAKEFIKLDAKKKELEISLWIDTVDKSKELIRAQQRRLEIFTEDYDNVNSQLEASTKYIEERYLYANSLLVKNEENINEIRSAESNISQLTSQKAVAESEKGYAQNQINSLETDLAAFENEGLADSGAKQRLEEKISAVSAEIDEKLRQQAQVQMQLDDLAVKVVQSGDEKGRLSVQMSAVNIRLQDEKIEMGSIDSTNDAVKENISLAKGELAKAQQYAQDSKKQADDVKEFIDITAETITRNMNIRGGLVMKKNSQQTKLDMAIKQTDDNISSQRQTEDRIRFLTEMENSLNGFYDSVKLVLKRSKEGALGGILGSVSQLVTVEKGYETAVEIALGAAAQNIVVENEAAAKRGIEYLNAVNPPKEEIWKSINKG